jgi:hypothetical protein
MIDNIGILSFQTSHIKFKVILNSKIFEKFQVTYKTNHIHQKNTNHVTA